MSLLTIVGTGFGAYIMAMAALSPCPLLVNTTSGTFIIVRQLFITLFLYILSLKKFSLCRQPSFL